MKKSILFLFLCSYWVHEVAANAARLTTFIKTTMHNKTVECDHASVSCVLPGKLDTMFKYLNLVSYSLHIQ